MFNYLMYDTHLFFCCFIGGKGGCWGKRGKGETGEKGGYVYNCFFFTNMNG